MWGLFAGEEGSALLLAIMREAEVALAGCLGMAALLAILAGGMIATLLYLALIFASPVFLLAGTARVAWHLLARRR